MGLLGNIAKGIGGLAENLVEGLTGSEALGDIAGIAANMLTGNVAGIGMGALDLADNVGKGVGKFAEGVWGAAKDAVKEFSNPGRVKAPKKEKAPKNGYAKLKAENKKQQQQINNLMKQVKQLMAGKGGGETGGVSGPGQTGGSSGAGQTGETGGASSSDPYEATKPAPIKFENPDDDMKKILEGPGSFETKILMLLMAMAKKKKGAMAEQMGKAMAAGDKAAGVAGSKNEGDIKAGAMASADQQNATMLMQQYANDVSQLTNLATNMQKLFHDSKMATIQNIR